MPYLTLSLYVDRSAGELESRRRAVGAQEVGEADLIERPAYRHVDALPGMADTAHGFQSAVALAGAALGDGDRSLERIDHVRRADVFRVAGQPVASVRASRGDHQPRPGQRFQQLADRWQAQARHLRNLGR